MSLKMTAPPGVLAEERHSLQVARVIAQLRAHAASPSRARPISFRKKAVSHQVPKRHDERRLDAKVDIRDLEWGSHRS